MSSKGLLQSRAKGCLLGQAVGDALGTRYEFMPASEVQKQVKADKTTQNRSATGFLPILGMGPFALTPGQVTDDTELAMGLARSLKKCETYDSDDVAAAYYSWYQTRPFDIGTTTRAALGFSDFSGKAGAYEAVRKSAETYNENSLSNGCLMRISPLGIAGANWDPEILRETGKKDCQLTNPNPISQEAVACYVSAVRTAILTGNPTETYESAVKCSESKIVKDLLEAAKVQAVPVKVGSKMINGDSGGMGYFGVALQGAFYELLHMKNFQTSLVDTVQRGGDTDTNGCIAGALLGAVCGFEDIPNEWRKTVMKAKPKRLQKYPVADMSDAEDLAVTLLGCKQPKE